MEAWFCSAKGGDAAAVSQLLEAFRPLLLKLANDGLDADLRRKVPASDVVQISLIKATLAYPKAEFGAVEDVASWLQTILTHEIGTVHRRFRLTKKRDTRREYSTSNPEIRKLIDLLSVRASNDGTEALSQQEEIERLRLAFQKLPSHHRKVINWRIVVGLSFEEIGRKIDRSADAARMYFGRIIRKLRSTLTETE